MKAPLTDFAPRNLPEAVDTLFNNLTEDDIDYIIANGSVGMHFGLGGQVRNAWGLWKDSELAQSIKTEYGLGHADDMSSIILSALQQKVLDIEPYDVSAEVAKCKDHWIKYKIDPLTQKQL